MTMNMWQQHQGRRHTLLGNPTYDQHGGGGLFAIPEPKNEDDDDTVATANTAELVGEVSPDKLRRKSDGSILTRGQYNGFGFEANNETHNDSYPSTAKEMMGKRDSSVQFADLEEPEAETETQDEYEAVLEEYELEIQRLERLNETLTANVATLTAAALDGGGDNSTEQVKVVEVERCLNCGGEHDDMSSIRSSISSRHLHMDITPNEEYSPLNDDIYNDMMLTEEHYIHRISKLQKNNQKMQQSLEKKKKLIGQLSMNLKTAAEKITDVGKEKEKWKAKFEELEGEKPQEGSGDGELKQVHNYQVQVVQNELQSLLNDMSKKSEAHTKDRQKLIDEYRSDDAIWNQKLEDPKETLDRVIHRLRKGDQVEDWQQYAASRVSTGGRTNNESFKGVNIWDSVTSLFGGPSQQQTQQQQQRVGADVDVDEHPVSSEIRSFDRTNLRKAPPVSADESDDESSSSGSSSSSSGSSGDDSEGSDGDEADTKKRFAAPQVRLAAQKAEQVRLERLAAEQKIEQERLEKLATKQKAELERLRRELEAARQKVESERAERENLALEQKEELERLEQERLASEGKIEQERVAEAEEVAAKQNAEVERLQQELEIARQRAESERTQRENLALEQREELDRLEQERLATERKIEQERVNTTKELSAKQSAELERLQKDLEAARGKATSERAERELLAAEQKDELKRLEEERLALEQKIEEERAELAYKLAAKQNAELERLQKELDAAKRKMDLERQEKERLAVELNNERERLEQQCLAAEQKAHQERLEKGRLAAQLFAAEEVHRSNHSKPSQTNQIGIQSRGDDGTSSDADSDDDNVEVASESSGEESEDEDQSTVAEEEHALANGMNDVDFADQVNAGEAPAVALVERDEPDSLSVRGLHQIDHDTEAENVGSTDVEFDADEVEEEDEPDAVIAVLRTAKVEVGGSDDECSENSGVRSQIAITNLENEHESVKQDLDRDKFKAMQGSGTLQQNSSEEICQSDPGRLEASPPENLEPKSCSLAAMDTSSVGRMTEQSQGYESDDGYVAREGKDENSSLCFDSDHYFTAHEADDDSSNRAKVLRKTDRVIDECYKYTNDNDSRDCDEPDAGVIMNPGVSLADSGVENQYIGMEATSAALPQDAEFGGDNHSDADSQEQINDQHVGSNIDKEASLEQSSSAVDQQHSVDAVGAISKEEVTCTSSEIAPDHLDIPMTIKVMSGSRTRSPGTIVSSTTAITDGTQARITAALENKYLAANKTLADTLEKIKEQRSKADLDEPDEDRSVSYYHNVVSQFTEPQSNKAKKVPDGALSNRLPRRELFQRRGSSCADLFVDIVNDVLNKPEDRQVLVMSKDNEKYLVPRYKPPVLPPQSSERSAPAFKKGQKDGYYVYKSSSGNEYAGHWKSGRRHGYGVAKYRDGEVFSGEWRRGRRHGHGVLHLANSEVFDGDWAANKKSGLGVYFWNDGEVDVSWYKDDARLESVRWTQDRRRAYLLDLTSSKKEQISLVRAANIVKAWERKRETFEC